MSKTRTNKNHIKRLDKVIHYIYDHLDEELNLDTLANVAHMSPYHWHRVYCGLFGESIIATVKRLRLHQAAGKLSKTDLPITQIARESGYPNLQSFTRIFNQAYGVPPARYRKLGKSNPLPEITKEHDKTMFTVTITHREELQLYGLKHQGSYMTIGQAFERTYGILAAANLINGQQRSAGIYYDDPSVVAEENLRSFAGVEVLDHVKGDLPLEQVTLSSGKYAVLRYQGPYSEIAPAYDWLYGQWLPNSEFEAADHPIYEEYINNPRDTPPMELLTDICLPLEP